MQESTDDNDDVWDELKVQIRLPENVSIQLLTYLVRQETEGRQYSRYWIIGLDHNSQHGALVQTPIFLLIFVTDNKAHFTFQGHSEDSINN